MRLYSSPRRELAKVVRHREELLKKADCPSQKVSVAVQREILAKGNLRRLQEDVHCMYVEADKIRNNFYDLMRSLTVLED